MLKMIPPGDIIPLKNYRHIDIDPESDKDFFAEIKKDGVHQSLLVRSAKGKPGKYELIAGYRRYTAAVKGELAEVPCNIKEIPDEDILEYQVKENLQRKDVHPMDEAAAFKAYGELKKADLKTLAAVFVKPEKYIAHRLALNMLCDDVKKDFLNEFLNISQAEVFAKLPHDQQKQLRKYARSDWGNDKGFYTKRVPDLNGYIKSNIMRAISSAPWKRDDAELVPAAGACSDCSKRTSCNAVLFAEVAKDDRCLDAKCFENKMKVFQLKQLETLIINNPELPVFKKEYGEVLAGVTQIINDHKVKVYKEDYNKVQAYKGTGFSATKAIQINGNDAGKIVTIYIKGTALDKTSSTKVDNKQLIADINARVSRSAEIEYEKVMKRIVDGIEEHSPLEKPLKLKMPPEIEALIWFMYYDDLEVSNSDLMDSCGLSEGPKEDYDKTPELLLSRILNLTPEQKASIVYARFMDDFGGNRRKGKETFFIRAVAKWIGFDVSAIDADFQAYNEKKRASADRRINELQKPKKAAAPAANSATPKKGVKKAAKKAVPKKAAKKK